MFRSISSITQTKINLLLEEMRSWPLGELKKTLQELAEQFDLDPFVVDRLARAEGFSLPSSPDPGEDPPDPSASTLDLDPEEVHAAALKPDPDSEWGARDEDTGNWRKKPTGEWELIKD